MIKVLHFADAHIDMASHGRHDPESGLPYRVMDFLKSLDKIVNTAITEQVDLVIFAGDAYKDRTPVPTYQREWGKRILKLSQAGIQTILLVGNHDLSPALGRAHALQEFETLEIPKIKVISKPELLMPEDFEGLPIQILALPWISRSRMAAALQTDSIEPGKLYEEMEGRLTELLHQWMDKLDPQLPSIFTAHASVQGAKYGSERTVMLGNDLVLSGSVVKDPRLSYTALGHIHKAQNLNETEENPPVIYPGSIERVDFGEVEDDKFFVIAELEVGKHTRVDWRKLDGRKFVDRFLKITSAEDIPGQLLAALPSQEGLKDAIVRLVVEYPRDYEVMLDEPAIRRHAEPAFEFHFIRRPQMDARLRLPQDQTVTSMTAADLLDVYWKTVDVKPEEREALNLLAQEVFSDQTGLE
ncbi:MAG: exonuclease SbcCD subunit D [Anaerolineaceae bacterium]|nr:exonuclease SbcCD subunit D [Anaerolineaceae bacterium]